MFSAHGLEDLNSLGGFAHRTRDEFAASGSEICSLCGFIFELVLQTYRGNARAGDERLVFRNSSPALHSQSSDINVLRGGFDTAPDIITITPFVKAGMNIRPSDPPPKRDHGGLLRLGDPAAHLISQRPLRRNVQSRSVVSAAKNLINACLRPDEPSKSHANASTPETQCSPPASWT